MPRMQLPLLSQYTCLMKCYSFDQVTPLVAAGFEVLETTKNVSLLLAAIQVLTVVFLALILLVLICIACILNPDLDRERRDLVTPLLKWTSSWGYLFSSMLSSMLFRVLAGGIFVVATASLGWSFVMAIQRDGRLEVDDAGQVVDDTAADSEVTVAE